MKDPSQSPTLTAGKWPPATAPVEKRDLAIVFLVSSVVALWAYHTAFEFFFVLDDYTYLLRATGMEPHDFTLRRALGTTVFYKFGYWLFGATSPVPWHIVALAFHVGNGVWLYALTYRYGLHRNAALLSSCMFVSSPLAFTVVHWIAGFQEISSTFFLLTTIGFACRQDRWRLLALLSFGLAMLCKESVLLAPALLPFLTGRRRDPLTVLLLLLGAVLFVASGLHQRMFESSPTEPYATDYGIGLLNNLGSAVVWFLTPWQAYPDRVPSGQPSHIPWAIGFMLFGTLSAWYLQRRLGQPVQRAWLVASFWFVLLLVPTLPLRSHFFAYYLYAAQMGYLALLSWIVWTASKAGARRLSLPRRTAVIPGLVVLGLGIYFSLQNSRTHLTLTLERNVHVDSLVRYQSIGKRILRQIRVANLPPEVVRVGILTLDTGPVQNPHSNRRVVVQRPTKAVLRGDKFFRLHMPEIDGRYLEDVPTAFEQPGTVFFLSYNLGQLQPMPDLASVFGVLAVTDFMWDRFPESLEKAQKGTALRQDEFFSWFAMAGLYAAGGQTAEATRILETWKTERDNPGLQHVIRKIDWLLQQHQH